MAKYKGKRGLAIEILRDEIVASLSSQGFRVTESGLKIPRNPAKSTIRRLHSLSVKSRRAEGFKQLGKKENSLLSHFADGAEIELLKVQPEIRLVKSGSFDEILFRYTSLHWSIPVSSGYGRRIRYLVIDKNNGKLMGIFGLGDPVYSMKCRDEYIGWSPELKKKRLFNVMDAFVLGAVPPYNKLLCGKLIAMLATSNEVRKQFKKQYGGQKTTISGVVKDPWMTMITTTSALGRSSLYNRIKFDGELLWKPIGYTKGTGDFHFSNGMYGKISHYVASNIGASSKKAEWGTGFRNKREVIRKFLKAAGLPKSYECHGVRRQVYAAPLASKTIRYLKGEVKKPFMYDYPVTRLWEEFRERWFLPRAERMPGFRSFRKASLRLWP